MRFTGSSLDNRVKARRIVCGGKRGWQSGLEGATDVQPGREAPLGGRMRPPLREHDYLLAAGTFAASTADGMVVTRPCVPVACAGTTAGTGAAADGVSPRALRTSASSLAIVSLFSFRKARAFSRPWPMRSPL